MLSQGSTSCLTTDVLFFRMYFLSEKSIGFLSLGVNMFVGPKECGCKDPDREAGWNLFIHTKIKFNVIKLWLQNPH